MVYAVTPGFLHHLQMASHNLAAILQNKVDEKLKFQIPIIKVHGKSCRIPAF